MTTAFQWLHGARPRTLPLAVAPIIGAAAIVPAAERDVLLLLLCATVALLLQIGVNYANDYSDGIRGTDAQRGSTGGPLRLVGQGLATADSVKRAAHLSFVLACLVGLVVVARSGDWRLLLLGVAAVPSAWFYTGGTRPYGYAGLGEVFVFTFFGLAAVVGTVWAQSHTVDAAAWWVAGGEGLLASAVLMVNNIRDIATDAPQGKRTLAVRLGDRRSRYAYALMVKLGLLGIVLGIVPSVTATGAWALAAIALAAVIWLGLRGISDIHGSQLVRLLAATSRTALAISAVGLILVLVAPR